jgi:hypothetical protein
MTATQGGTDKTVLSSHHKSVAGMAHHIWDVTIATYEPAAPKIDM